MHDIGEVPATAVKRMNPTIAKNIDMNTVRTQSTW